MKNSFTILEIILSILISSIVIINTSYFSNELFQTNKDMQKIEELKLDLLSTKIFLQKNNQNLESTLIYSNDTIYFKTNILLKNVSDFNITKKENYYEVTLEIEKRIKENWKIRL